MQEKPKRSWLVPWKEEKRKYQKNTCKLTFVCKAASEQNVAPAGQDVTSLSRLVSSERLLPEERIQLTDAVLSNLTDLGLSNISLFYFDDSSDEGLAARGLSRCKLFPGDLLFPGELVWKVFDLITGNALIKTVPLGAACYKGKHYDAEKCQFLLANWANSTTQSVPLHT